MKFTVRVEERDDGDGKTRVVATCEELENMKEMIFMHFVESAALAHVEEMMYFLPVTVVVEVTASTDLKKG